MRGFKGLQGCKEMMSQLRNSVLYY